jgi:hypothetical protein
LNIGDIWFDFRGNPSTLTVDANKAGQAAALTGSATFNQKFSQSIKQGLGLGAGMSVFSALTDAARRAGAFIGDAIGAATADEASQAKLTAAIRANTVGWDGNSAAIEGVLKARMNLGFSDDEQRDSLAVLVAATGSVTTALDVQRTAMDLARLKGIDLAAASKAVALGMGGQGRALKELGINVKDYTTKQEVLAAIQKKAAGQAEAYGNTTAGAMVEMQVAIDEAMETIGYRLLPTMKDFAFVVRDNVVPAVETLDAALSSLAGIKFPGTEFGLLSNVVDLLQMPFHTRLWEALDGTSDRLAKTSDAAMVGAAAWDTYAEGAAASREPSESAADGIRAIWQPAFDARAELRKLEQTFKDAARTARDNRLAEAYDLKVLPIKISLAKIEVAKAQKDLEDARTTEQKRQAQLRLADAEKELADLLNTATDREDDYWAAGGRLGRALGKGLYDQVKAWNTLTAAQIAALDGGTPSIPGRRIEALAGGGPVRAGVPYIVGEKRPELFVPHESGTIVPSVGGGGSPAVIRLEIGGRPLLDYVDENLVYRRRI